MEGPVSSTQSWDWTAGGFFLEGHSDNKTPAGNFKIMAVLGYDPATKMYTYNAYDSWGEVITAKGSVSGDTWTWTTEATMQGTLHQDAPHRKGSLQNAVHIEVRIVHRWRHHMVIRPGINVYEGSNWARNKADEGDFAGLTSLGK